MKKFECTVLHEMRMGDRFYFVTDSKKRVWELNSFNETKSFYTLVGAGTRKSRPHGKKTMDPVRVIFLTSALERQIDDKN